MKRHIIITGMILIAAQAIAQQPRQMSLRQCIDTAMKGNINIKVAAKGIERAKAMQGTAWDLDKTELSLAQDPTSGGSPDNSISITQQIEFPTVYAARHSQLKAETKAEQSKAEMLRREICADIASLYWQLTYEKERLDILRQQDSCLASYNDIASKRYKAGESRQMENLSAKRMLMENIQEMADAKAGIAATQRRLMTLMNTDYTIEPTEKGLKMIEKRALDYNFMLTAEGQYAQDKLNVADKAIKVARNGYAPSLSLSLRNQLVISSWNPYHADRTKFDGGNFMGFEVGIGIPLFYGATKAKVKAAKKEREMAELEMQQIEALRRQEYSTSIEAVSMARNKADYYNTQGKKTAEEMMRIGSIEYKNGEITYLEYVNIMQSYIESKLKRAAAINEYNQAVISLMRITDGL